MSGILILWALVSSCSADNTTCQVDRVFATKEDCRASQYYETGDRCVEFDSKPDSAHAGNSNK